MATLMTSVSAQTSNVAVKRKAEREVMQLAVGLAGNLGA